jgi:1-acyl-sn-glycerol-3-phosphate acyltransferase
MPEIKPQKYKEKRPAEHFAHFHEWTRTHKPDWVYEVVRMVLTPIALFMYRTRAIGTENIPAEGAFIIAPNHFSNMDHFFCGVYIRRKIHFMAKSQLFGNPIGDFIFRKGGVFPVRRGHRDEEPFITSQAIFDRGGCVLMYAEGGRSRTGGLGDPKPGVGRLALESGVPVVPAAIHGSHTWRLGNWAPISVAWGEPMRFDGLPKGGKGYREASEQVGAKLRELHEWLVELHALGRPRHATPPS